MLKEAQVKRCVGTVAMDDGEYFVTNGPATEYGHPRYITGPRGDSWVRAWGKIHDFTGWVEGVPVNTDQALFTAARLTELPEKVKNPILLPLDQFLVSGSTVYKVDALTMCRQTLYTYEDGTPIWEGDFVAADLNHPDAIGIVCENVKWRETQKELKYWVHMFPSNVVCWGEWVGLKAMSWHKIGDIMTNTEAMRGWDGLCYGTECPDEFQM